MSMQFINPFNITKAVDFTDQQIHDYWVDMPQNSLEQMMKPHSPMPIIILGGKGSGKTHLIRHFSYPLQKIRHREDLTQGITLDGYLGIYMRCSGLNAARFSNKGQDDDKWLQIFSYYMELWLSQLLLEIICDAFVSDEAFNKIEEETCNQILSLFDAHPSCQFKKISDMIEYLHDLQKEVDLAVNNCPITGELDVNVKITRGNLIFGIPKVLSELFAPLAKCSFLYLIDEYENLTLQQQKYINSLIREKTLPTSFRIGVKLYGLKTLKTLCDEEENKEGSEYETVPLDALLRKNNHYVEFSNDLIRRRLKEVDLSSSSLRKAISLEPFFEKLVGDRSLEFVFNNYDNLSRPYFLSLRKKLEKGLKLGVSWGVTSKKKIDVIISNLSIANDPLLEKTNILLLYKDWFNKKDLVESSKNIKLECKAFIKQPLAKASRHKKTLDYFRADLMAQLCRECRQPQRYLGVDGFIHMSQGMPRYLLIILKQIYQWSVFNGEDPFGATPISIKSQQSGIDEASNWFFRDARTTGKDGPVLQDGISRLAEFFKEIRFSDKPTECSLCTFSVDLSKCSKNTQDIISLAENWSLLINVAGGQKDRNTKRVDMKYQLNCMLAPRWDLPIYRRGAISLQPEEVNSIFDTDHYEDFEIVKKNRVERMTAPLFGKKIKIKKVKEQLLPGFEE